MDDADAAVVGVVEGKVSLGAAAGLIIVFKMLFRSFGTLVTLSEESDALVVVDVFGDGHVSKSVSIRAANAAFASVLDFGVGVDVVAVVLAGVPVVDGLCLGSVGGRNRPC